jgi:hypothetical protein
MATHTIKTAVSIPRQDYKDIEAFRKRHHQSRSEVLVMAFRAWLHLDSTRELEERYEEGYRQYPEKIADVAAFMNAGLPAWKDE